MSRPPAAAHRSCLSSLPTAKRPGLRGVAKWGLALGLLTVQALAGVQANEAVINKDAKAAAPVEVAEKPGTKPAPEASKALGATSVPPQAAQQPLPLPLSALKKKNKPIRAGEGGEASGSATPAAPAAQPAVAPTSPSPNASVLSPQGDSFDALREKLSQRLGGRTTADPLRPGELRVQATTKPGAAGASNVLPARKAVPTGAHTHLDGHGHGWGYEGASGPAFWASLSKDNALCAKGQRQSPIDIQGGLPLDLEPIEFIYRAGFFSEVDNGHTLQVTPAPGNQIRVGTRRFELQSLHFHRPSEERVNGRRFEMSVHLVHKDSKGRLAVIALLVEEGPEHPGLQQLWNQIPLEKHDTVLSTTEFDPRALLPSQPGYYTYMGSLTTPPCSEDVLWLVMQQPIAVSAQQLAVFSRLYSGNARPVQPVNGRLIKQSR